jgi:hypothetical protein
MKKISIVIFVLILGLLFGCVMANAQYRDKNALKDPEISGRIDAYLFSRSIPEHMAIGESYKIIVFVKNTGKAPAYFLVGFIAPGEFIYPEFDVETIELDGGKSHRIEFFITPIKPHIGELNITAKLYLISPLLMEIDSTADSVFLIKRKFSTEGIIASISITVVAISAIISVVTLFLFYKKKSAAKRKP